MLYKVWGLGHGPAKQKGLQSFPCACTQVCFQAGLGRGIRRYSWVMNIRLHTGLEPNLTCSRHDILNSKETWNSIIYHLIAIRLILLILWLVTETGFFIDRFLTQAWVMFYYLRYCACLFLKAVLWRLCIQPFFFFLVSISCHHCVASHIPSTSYHSRVGGNVIDWKWTDSKLPSFLHRSARQIG